MKALLWVFAAIPAFAQVAAPGGPNVSGGSVSGPVTQIIAGTGITISPTSGMGVVTINSTGGGVTSITGTSGQITASASTGAVTLSLPSALTGITSIAATGAFTLTTGSGTDINLTPGGVGKIAMGKAVDFLEDTWVTSGGNQRFFFQSGSGSTFIKGGGNATGTVAIFRDGGDNQVMSLAASGLMTVLGALTTGAPTAGSAGAWKLGALITSSGLLASTTQAVRINIGGTDYSLAVLTSNP